MSLQARAGIERAGSSRAGSFIPNVVLVIDGVDRTCDLDYESHINLSIDLTVNDDVDTARFALKRGSTEPIAKQIVVISLGSASNRTFAGQIDRVRLLRDEDITIPPVYQVECSDWLRLFNRRLILAEYSSASATEIAKDIIANWTSGFTASSVEAGLPSIDYFPLTNERPSSALSRLVTLMGGGGWFIDPNRDLHFFGTAGDVSAKAPTPALSLTNTRTSLKRFSHEYETTQIRTRVYTEGQDTTCPLLVPAGATSFPIADGIVFSHGADLIRLGTQRLTTFSSWLLSPQSYLAIAGLAGAQSSVIHTAAAAGSTTLEVDVFSGGLQASGWLKIGNDWVYYTSIDAVTGAGVYYIFQIPGTGYGSLPIDVAVGDRISVSDMIDSIPASGTGAILATQQPGSTVAMIEQSDDAGVQAALAAIEGGDGIHEHLRQDGRLSRAGAAARGQAELDAFADEAGLVRVEWQTDDLRTMPGAPQVIAITGTGGLSTTLTITRVEMEFTVQNYKPWKTCTAETVRLADLSEAVLTDRS